MSMTHGGRMTRAEVLRAADGIRQSQARVLALARVRERSDQDRQAWLTAAAELHLRVLEHYERLEDVKRRIKFGDDAAVEDALTYLTADPWCFRSGYVKADLMHLLANHAADRVARSRLRDVVLRRVATPQPRLLRPTARLAAVVWDEDLARGLRQLEEHDPGSPVSRAAGTVARWALEQQREVKRRSRA